ncbi:MAG: hypothetical protein ACYTEQ_30030 [Planctomycetota bacterium]
MTSCAGANAIHGWLFINGPLPKHAGAGNDDSCILWLYSNWQGTRTLIDSQVCAAFPCSLDVSVLDTTGLGSGTLKGDLDMRYWIKDSLSDTTGVVMNYNIKQYIELK